MKRILRKRYGADLNQIQKTIETYQRSKIESDFQQQNVDDTITQDGRFGLQDR
ncbi:hypothetical protein I4U23_016172 [Adineta vaga]|nr:hypothetical protein I4U23_016172 [Adineta vaga]